MSDAPIPQADEALPVGKLLFAAAVAVVIFALAVGVAWRMSLSALPSRLPRTEAEIGLVNQRPFALERTAAQLKAAQQAQLSSWGWADRDQQLIHLPIDRAMDLLAESKP